MALTSTSADCPALTNFSSSSADIVDEYGKLIPIASKADDMVLAVNIPPQEPAPGEGVALNLRQFYAVINFMRTVLTNRFKRADNGQVLPLYNVLV